MPVGILILCHEGVGGPLVDAARRMLGSSLPLPTEAFEAAWDADADSQLPRASAALRRVDGGEGVLMLVDLYGATPARIAGRLAQLGTPARRVSGLSLPMLLRVQNYPEQPLDELARTAAGGARNGVVIDDA
jgi:PTS system ascorbate-specific IIA component